MPKAASLPQLAPQGRREPTSLGRIRNLSRQSRQLQPMPEPDSGRSFCPGLSLLPRSLLNSVCCGFLPFSQVVGDREINWSSTSPLSFRVPPPSLNAVMLISCRCRFQPSPLLSDSVNSDSLLGGREDRCSLLSPPLLTDPF